MTPDPLFSRRRRTVFVRAVLATWVAATVSALGACGGALGPDSETPAATAATQAPQQPTQPPFVTKE